MIWSGCQIFGALVVVSSSSKLVRDPGIVYPVQEKEDAPCGRDGTRDNHPLMLAGNRDTRHIGSTWFSL